MTQGKTLGNNENRFAAAHAIDKDLSTSAVTRTSDGAGWVKLGFDETKYVHKVFVYYWFYTNWYDFTQDCAKSEDQFEICVDNDKNVDVSVYQGDVKQKSCGTLQLTYGLEQSDQIYTLLCNTEGDTVKFSKDTGNIAVLEVVITGTGNDHIKIPPVAVLGVEDAQVMIRKIQERRGRRLGTDHDN